MKFFKSIHAVDSHTAGEPTRIIIGGLPNIPGASMAEKKAYLEEHFAQMRHGLLLEPRGHDNMFGSIITAPVSPEADFGIIYMCADSYFDMCGHGTIGACTVAVETGMVAAREPITEVTAETPAGLVKAEVAVRDGKVRSVTITNVPAFMYQKDVTASVPELGDVVFDIAFGGMFMAVIKAETLGVEIEPSQARVLAAKGNCLRSWINENLTIRHPILEHIKTVDAVQIWSQAKNENAFYRNVVISGIGHVDRSPCGTGTSCHMAVFVARGELYIGQDCMVESIVDTYFTGRPIAKTTVGQYEAIIPQVTGSAYITGFNHFVFDEDDPMLYGFSLR